MLRLSDTVYKQAMAKEEKCHLILSTRPTHSQVVITIFIHVICPYVCPYVRSYFSKSRKTKQISSDQE